MSECSKAQPTAVVTSAQQQAGAKWLLTTLRAKCTHSVTPPHLSSRPRRDVISTFNFLVSYCLLSSSQRSRSAPRLQSVSNTTIGVTWLVGRLLPHRLRGGGGEAEGVHRSKASSRFADVRKTDTRTRNDHTNRGERCVAITLQTLFAV